jgi:hypothetical protein
MGVSAYSSAAERADDGAIVTDCGELALVQPCCFAERRAADLHSAAVPWS